MIIMFKGIAGFWREYVTG